MKRQAESDSLASKDVYDVVVYGGTSAGVVAGVQAARMGRRVVIVEPGRHLGGLTSGGLGMTDAGDKRVIGGLAREFYRRVRRHYENPASWTWEKREDYRFMQPGEDALFRFEPHVAEAIYEDMLREAGVAVVRGERLDRAAGVRLEGTAIRAIAMVGGRVFEGAMFIDATYEGDLMAAAGVSYHVGREGNAVYDETLNGVQTANATKHQFLRDVDPHRVPGDPASGLLPGVQAGGPGEEGAGDSRVQAYNFRLCLTNVPENRMAYPKPEGYDPLRYELLARYIAALPEWMEVFGNHQAMPNGKTDTNNHGAFGSDNIGMNHAYPEADEATREAIFRDHVVYHQGMMWFLANDPRVPESIRRRVGEWGLAKDEFADSGHWPHQLYIREARRMISDYVQTEADCRCLRETPEPVGMGSYQMDSHNCQRYVDASGKVRNEGDIQVGLKAPYKISFGSIRPKADQCTNLLVPVCISSSHIAYGSVRMEPVFMVLGQSAATAACLALAAGTPVQAVPYETLRQRLLADGQVLERPAAP